jgi:hypothetical protein
VEEAARVPPVQGPAGAAAPRLRGVLHAGAFPVAAAAGVVLVTLAPTWPARLAATVYGVAGVDMPVRHGTLPWDGDRPGPDAHRRPEPLCRTVHPLLNKRIAALSPAKQGRTAQADPPDRRGRRPD